MTLPLITISIPVFNEEDNMDALYARLAQLGETLADECRLEFLLTDNHSTDGTWLAIQRIAALDPRVRAIRFSKNFGFQRSILANYMHASGDAVMQIDADLQDPPEMLVDFLEKWRAGYKVIYGIRKERPESWLTRNLRRLGYWVINRLSAHEIPMNAGDFRLIDRQVINVLLKMRSSVPYLRGAISSLGFAQTGIEYKRAKRQAGVSKFNAARLLPLGAAAIVNHSTLPLRLALILGVTTTGLAAVGMLYYLGLRLFLDDVPQGLASIHILVLAGIGMNALFLGIIGEYIYRIYLLLSNEPVAIAEDLIGIRSEDLKI